MLPPSMTLRQKCGKTSESSISTLAGVLHQEPTEGTRRHPDLLHRRFCTKVRVADVESQGPSEMRRPGAGACP